MSKPHPEPHPPAPGPEVHFEHVNSMETVHFKAAWTETLGALWQRAYEELKEPRRPDDHLQTDSGSDMSSYLDLTLEQLRDRHLVQGFHFQIVGPTGGA